MISLKQTLIVASIMLLTGISLPYLTESNDQPLKRSLSEFPMQIGKWKGTAAHFEKEVYEILGVDDSLLADYRNPKGEKIQLYIGYYQSQRVGEIIHSPKNCMPGSGWNIVETSLMPLDLKDNKGAPVKIIKLVLQNGIQRQVVLYWFHSRGRVISSEYSQKIYLVWDSITKHRTDGSFVRLLSQATDKGEARTTENLEQFAEKVLSILNDYIPS